MNMHMLQCYKEHIDDTIDVTSPENAYYMEGSLLCQFVLFMIKINKIFYILELIIKVHYIVNVFIQYLKLIKYVLQIIFHFHMNMRKFIGNW